MKTIYIIFALYVIGCMACGDAYPTEAAPPTLAAKLTTTELSQVKAITDPLSKTVSSQAAMLTTLNTTVTSQTKTITALQTKIISQDATINLYKRYLDGSIFGLKKDTITIPALPILIEDVRKLKAGIK